MEKNALLKSIDAAVYVSENYFPCSSEGLASFCRSNTGPAHARLRGQYLFRVGDLDAWARSQIQYVPAPAQEAASNVTAFPGRRTRQFNFRVTPEVYEMIHRLAGERKQSAADFLIYLVECADQPSRKSASA